MAYEPHSILALEAAPFGISLEMLPALRALRANFPTTFIIAAAPAGTCELLEVSLLADSTINLGVIKHSAQGYGSSIKRIARLFNSARRIEVDIVLDFSPRLETQLVSRLIIGGRTITPQKMPQILEGLLRRAGPRRGRTGHAGEVESVLGQLGIKITDRRLAVDPPFEENERFEKQLARHGSRGGEPVVVLYSSKAGASIGWPVEHFGELASNLANSFGARIVAADEPFDTGFTDSVEAILPHGAICLREPRALELAAAIARASILVTDDHGIARMGLSLDVPVLEVANSAAARSDESKSHRVVTGASGARIPVGEVFDVACQMLQESRSVSLFRR